MFLEEINLINFRKHQKISIKTKKNINIIIGENGIGKTNIVEALYFQTHKKSFKTNKNTEIIKTNEKKATIKTKTNNNNKKFINETIIEERKVTQNKINYTTTLFAPQITQNIFLNPEQKRIIIDEAISILNPSFKKTTQEFNKILENRNKILKKYAKKKAETTEFHEIQVWNTMFMQKSLLISKKRNEYINEIKEKFADKISKLSKNKIKTEIKFISSPRNLSEKAMAETIIKNFEKEKILGYSLEGCQKDDFIFSNNNTNAKNNISQGEQWIITLAFVLVQHDIFKEKIEDRLNLLLLDDVFISLDLEKQKQIIEVIKNETQTFITTAKKTNIPRNTKANYIFL